MRKSLHVAALLALVSAPAYGVQLSPDQALARLNMDKVARSIKSIGSESLRLVHSESTQSGSTAYYVFADAEKTMFVSADDAGVPLLGYVDNPNLDMESMPPQMRWWLSEYARQIEWASANGIVSKTGGEKTEFAPISPLCATTWDQEAPYNNLCPKKGSRTTVTGCVATAMAQVMKYFNWPVTGAGTVSYRWNRQTLTMNLGATTFDWANMLNSYPSANSGTSAQRTAVATLMKACGYAVEMEYDIASNGGSGASSYELANVLVENFGYDKGARMEWRDFYALEDWNEMIYQNLANVGPLLYGGSGSDGGHEFVCDGYRSGGMFHINWGWSGYYDGYFKLDALDPEGLGTGGGAGGFNYYQDVTLAIQKPQEGSEYPSPYLGIDGSLTATTDGRYVSLSAGSDGGFWNLGNYAGNFHIAIQLTPQDGGEPYYVNMDGMGNMCVTLPALQGWEGLYFDVPATVPGGTYQLVPVYRLDGVGDWIPMRTYYYAPSSVTVSFASSGVENVEIESTQSDQEEWFNLQGQRVDSSRNIPGVYVKRRGGVTEKVVVR